MKDKLQIYFDAIGNRESGNDYKNDKNPYGYLGKYQMGKLALADAGYYSGGKYTGKDGVYTDKDFLNNPQAQENAMRIYKQKQWGYIKGFAPEYSGKYINGIHITYSGMLAAAHLNGHAKLREYLASNGVSKAVDGFGTSIEEYLEKFSDYDVSEITGLPDDSIIDRYSDGTNTNRHTKEQEQNLSKIKSSDLQNKYPSDNQNKIQKSEYNLKDILSSVLKNSKNTRYLLSKLLKILQDGKFSLSNILNSINDAEGLNIDKPKNEQSNMHSIDDATKEELEINKDSTQKAEPEDDGLVVIPDKYKDKSNGENAEEPQLSYKKRVEIKAYSPDGELIKESNDSEDQEPEINPEYLKPIELEEDGMATGGAAGISDKFVNPNVYNRDSVEYPETSLGDEELPMPSAKNKFDFFENSMKELMKHQRSFRYDAKGGKEYSISTISRKLDEITKTLDGIQEQLDYHEKVVNIYNTPELATFYLYKPVENILASILEDYCIMEGIEILDI